MSSVPADLTKTYPARGPMQQFRFSQATVFSCFRCGQGKKSKLITLYGGDWSGKLCNGCYGYLLSLYDIKAGTSSDDERVEQLSSLLLATLKAEEWRQAERLLLIADNRANELSPEAIRFLATSEFISPRLRADIDLDWSPVVIGLCKAVEVELVDRFIRPLANHTASIISENDVGDRDIGRVAAFCADQNRKPPELGAISHFLRTVLNSQKRRQSSQLIQTFLNMLAEWRGSQWVLDKLGLQESLDVLAIEFRNRAAHIDTLTEPDYRRCHELVAGPEGVLWKLVASSQRLR